MLLTWSKGKPRFTLFRPPLELESLLANQETLARQMASVSVKDEEEALFTRKGRSGARSKKTETAESSRRRGGSQQGGAWRSKTEADRRPRSSPGSIESYNCDKNGNFAHDCRSRKKKTVKGNSVTATSYQNESEEEWVFSLLDRISRSTWFLKEKKGLRPKRRPTGIQTSFNRLPAYPCP